MRRAGLIVLLTLAGLGRSAPALDLALGGELLHFSPKGEVVRESLSPRLVAPLGSLWKLFVYFFLVDKMRPAPPYVCTGKSAEEKFCCAKGLAVGRDEALARSCGLFFRPGRLGLSSEEWRAYWAEAGAPAWLTDLGSLGPARRVPVKELMSVLETLAKRPLPFLKTRSALVAVLTDGTGRGTVREWGSTVSVKTYTWNDPAHPERFVGGFAGWLADGSPVWAEGEGDSHRVLARWAARLIPYLGRDGKAADRECVEVPFLDHYPIAEVVSLPDGRPLAPGLLSGECEARLRNGKRVRFVAEGDVRLVRSGARLQLIGRFELDEYVARSLTREVSSRPEEAAKAFALVIRTYVLQNARRSGGCLVAPDSTRFQRVSLAPPPSEAWRIARWTSGLGLKGVAVHYHSLDASRNRISWVQAKRLAKNGAFFDEILHTAFPSARLAVLGLARSECHEDPRLERWLAAQSVGWRRRLENEAGFAPPDFIRVCALEGGASFPYVDYAGTALFARPLTHPEDEIALVHEYLHLAFRDHPRGRDQGFIEATARQLVAPSLVGLP